MNDTLNTTQIPNRVKDEVAVYALKLPPKFMTTMNVRGAGVSANYWSPDENGLKTMAQLDACMHACPQVRDSLARLVFADLSGDLGVNSLLFIVAFSQALVDRSRLAPSVSGGDFSGLLDEYGVSTYEQALRRRFDTDEEAYETGLRYAAAIVRGIQTKDVTVDEVFSILAAATRGKALTTAGLGLVTGLSAYMA